MPSKGQSILLGAFVAVALTLVQLFLVMSGGGTGTQILQSAICCLTAIAGAGVAVWHYTTTYELTIPAGTGAGLGAAATSLGYAIAYVIGLLLQAVGVMPSDEELMERAREQALQQNPELSAEQLDQIMGFAESMSGTVGALINLVVLAIVGAIVGAIAASIFKKGRAGDDLDPVA